MKNKIVVIGPDSVHVENFIQLIRKSFKEIIFIGEHKLDSPLTNREYILTSRSIDPYKIFGRYSKIRGIIETEKPDVVHIHQVNRVAFLASFYLRKTNIPFIVTAWGSDVLLVPKKNIIAKRIITSVLKSATIITADSRDMLDAIHGLDPESRNKTHLIFFGIDPIIPEQKEKIIFSNRLHEKLYNIDIIIKQFAKFRESNKDWKLIIAGAGSLTNSYISLVEKLGITDSVHFAGWLDKTKNESYYKKASIYVSIPSSDGTSVSLLEAMSASCIPIVGDIPVSSEWIQDEVNGIVIKSFDDNFFKRALLINQEKVRDINIKLINKKATKKITSNEYNILYESISDKKRICHISTVHLRYDVRIFYKECTSLAKFYEVHFIVADGKGDEIRNDVHIHDIGLRQDSRLNRVRIDAQKAYQKARSLNCELYHFHDPELITIARKLQKKDVKVIYDVHEDLPRQIYGKPYMGNFFKPGASKMIEFFENRVAKQLDYIFTATPFIRDRFMKINSNTIDINNFPIISENLSPTDFSEKEDSLSYVGGIFKNRGVYELIESLKYSKVKLHLAGEFESEDFKAKCQSSDGWKYVEYYGYLNRREVVELLNKSRIGIVSLYPLRNYLDSLPIKMFEYMLASIPVIASDFPYWKKIVEDNECGVTVSPKDSEAVAEKTIQLISNPKLAAKMGLNGRNAVLDHYNWCMEEKKILDVYNKLLM